jgi:ribosomal protein L11 methyltransferase
VTGGGAPSGLMHFLQLSFVAAERAAAVAETACFELGALAVTLADAADSAILEPAPGTTPLWPQVHVTALFTSDADAPALTRSLCAVMTGLTAADVAVEQVADRPWESEWLRDFHAMRFGQRLWVAPLHEPVTAPGATVVAMDPGLAFGTGTHATTALCLEWLDGARLAGRRVIDYGCGSGVLAIAALKLGAAHAHAVDIDAQALLATASNAATNGVRDRISIGAPDSVMPPADILMANILAVPLIELAPRFADLVVPGGALVLSGLMTAETDAVTLACQSWFHMNEPRTRNEWARIDGTRRPT